MELRKVRVLVAMGTVFALFAVSFCEPVLLFRQVQTTSHQPDLPIGTVVKTAKQMLLASLFGPFVGNFAGLANPLLMVGCFLVLRRKTRAAITCLGFAVLVALQTFQMRILPYPEDEGGVVMSYLMHPLAGWYCWFGSLVLALAIALEQQWSISRALHQRMGDDELENLCQSG